MDRPHVDAETPERSPRLKKLFAQLCNKYGGLLDMTTVFDDPSHDESQAPANLRTEHVLKITPVSSLGVNYRRTTLIALFFLHLSPFRCCGSFSAEAPKANMLLSLKEGFACCSRCADPFSVGRRRQPRASPAQSPIVYFGIIYRPSSPWTAAPATAGHSHKLGTHLESQISFSQSKRFRRSLAEKMPIDACDRTERSAISCGRRGCVI